MSFAPSRGMLPTETHAVEKKTRPPTFDYSLNPYMKKRWDALGRKLAFSAKDQTSWRSWRRALARKLKQLTGYDTMIRTPPRPRITGQKDLGDLIRQHVVIRTEPGVLMPMYVLMPKSSPGPHPVILAPHGHSGGGKAAVAGLRDDPAAACRRSGLRRSIRESAAR